MPHARWCANACLFFTAQHDHIDFRLKNVNEGEVKKVWRYQAWDSYSPNEQKWRLGAWTAAAGLSMERLIRSML